MTSYQHIKTTAEIMEIARTEPWFYVIQPTLATAPSHEKPLFITINNGCIQVVEQRESAQTCDALQNEQQRKNQINEQKS